MLKANNDIHAYKETFLSNLYDRYTDPEVIKELRRIGNQFVLEFANAWPFFLKNELLIDELIRLSQTNLIME